MSACHRTAAGFAAALALLVLLPLHAGAAETWQASREFKIDPDRVPGRPAGGWEARYQLFDPLGKPAGLPLSAPAANPFKWLQVPPAPGAYELEAWVVDEAGTELARASTTLRFDDVPPAPAGAVPPTGWLRGGDMATLGLEPPAALPLSGLGGYAISLDRGSGVHPCTNPSLCTPAETDLGPGASLAPVPLGTLPQGLTYARVVAVSGASVPSSVSSAIFRVDATDPLLSLSGAGEAWRNGPVRVFAHATDSLSGMEAAGTAGPLTGISVDGGGAATSPGDTAATWVGGSGVHAIGAFARDAAGNVGELAGAALASAVVRIDEDPPRVVFARAQDPAEPERVEARVTDPLSGPSADKGSISLRLAGTPAAYEKLPTRVEAGRLVARWDSDSYSPGKYEFLAAGFDAAGNAAAGTDREKGGRMFLVNPVKVPVALATGLSRRRFGGRLRRVGGGGVARQRVAIVEAFAAGAEPQRRTSLRTTDANGDFSLRLPPGPSREVTARFAGTSTLTKAAGASARLGAATGLRLRASSTTAVVGGRPVVFSGAIGAQGAAKAVRGLAVELQFRYPGAPWRGFRTVEADRHGRFRYAYRFSDDDSRDIRFQFRAHVKGREGWPYGPGTSRPVTVTGR